MRWSQFSSASIALLCCFGGHGVNGWIGERLRELSCHVVDCCGVANNLTRLEDDLKTHIFGQHIASHVVLGALRAHVDGHPPRKALAISFHGWTGSGKTYVSDFIIDALYTKGILDRPAVHRIHATLYPNPDLAREYKAQLQSLIIEKATQCPQSLFLFEEVDEMPAGVLDAINPFLDYYASVRGVDFRRCIFVFLSNSGGSAIVQQTYRFWQDGKERGNLRLSDFEALIDKGAFNEPGGLYRSSAIQKNLIDHFVPFLPLERHHVRKCIRAEARRAGKSIRHEEVESIVEDMLFWPNDTKIFSKKGCKGVEQKVHLLWERDDDKDEL